MKRTLAFAFFISLLPAGPAAGQHALPPGLQIERQSPPPVNDERHPCISPEEYARMEEQIIMNRKRLGLDQPANRETSTSLQWPLRPAAGMNDCGFFYVSAFVDMNTLSGQVRDWNCGTRTYDGHRGIDIVGWPFIWDKMDRNLNEVIAAAPGTIIAKVDGNFDRVCNPTGSEPPNYIIVQHADGSTALYGHLKKNSLTPKAVGQAVSGGEYLGIAGSAGVSTGAHLHFEVRRDGNFANYIDPFYGSCNTGIGASWWASQKPYAEPEILKLSLHNNWPSMASCPNTVDTTYEVTNFIAAPGAQAIFYACSKHVVTGDTWNFRIRNPDNSIFDSWNYTSASTRNTSTLGWSRNLPVNPGTYTFEGTFNNITCTKTFTVQLVTGTGGTSLPGSVRLFPNPAHGTIYVKMESPSLLGEKPVLALYNATGQLVQQVRLSSLVQETRLPPVTGIYLYRIINAAGKIIQGGTFMAN